MKKWNRVGRSVTLQIAQINNKLKLRIASDTSRLNDKEDIPPNNIN